MRKSWWKVPLYGIAAGWVSFQLEIRVLGLLSQPAQAFPAGRTLTLYWVECQEWYSFVRQLLAQTPLNPLNPWVQAVIGWVLPPYLFVLFGKKSAE